MNEFWTTVVLIVIFGLMIAVGVIATKDTPTYKYGLEVNEVITECEKSLARDQHCVPVYGAKVFEE